MAPKRQVRRQIRNLSSKKKSSPKPGAKPSKKVQKGAQRPKPTGTGTIKGGAKKKKPVSMKKSRIKKGKAGGIQKLSRNRNRKTSKKRTAGSLGKSQAKTTASPKSSLQPFFVDLTATIRYNLAGLLVCAIDRSSDHDFKRLRSVLEALDLPSSEQDNLIRLSQGFTIPKLFADGIPQEKATQIMKGLMKIVMKDGAYKRQWRSDIHQVAVWLGIPGSEMEAVEQESGCSK